jgi:hypothetical protein
MAKNSASTRIAALLAGAVLAVSTAACGSSTSTPTAPKTSAQATGTASSSVGEPGCGEAVAAFQDTTTNLGTKIRDLPSLQAFATDLVSRLNAAAAKATDPKVRSAIDKLAADLNALVTVDQNSNGDQVQAQLSALVKDGQALVEACS